MKVHCLIILFIISFSPLFAEVIDAKQNKLDDRTAQIRLHGMEAQMDLPFTSETRRLLDIYTYSYLPGARRIVERSKRYFAQYDHILAKKGLPAVLKNIAIVESNLDPWTFSSRGAAGVWQLMKGTARSKGLIIDNYVDERFDPILASSVAFDYLDQLHGEFQDWNLALIAYNFGPSALRKAMKYCGSREYEDIKEALPRESKRYASRLAAASYLSTYFAEHSKSRKTFESDINLAGIRVYDYITFDEIAAITGLERQEIILSNPAITYDYLPTNSKGYTIHLPLEAMSALIADKGWSGSDIIHFDFHQSEIESMLPFHTSFSEDDKENDSEDKEDSQNMVSEFLASRREQILQMLSFG